MTIRAYRPEDREVVIEVWIAAGLTRPWNDPDKDIDRKLAIDPEGFLVAVESDRVVGTVMAGYEGHRGWIQYMAVHPDFQGSGYGKALVEAAIDLLRARGCPKVNLQVRKSNAVVVDFYKRAGFAEDDVLSMGLRLIPDAPPS